MKKGKVVSCVGGTYSIYCDGIIYNVIAKGIFRFKNKQIIVGDNVLFDDELCVINEIEERTNQIIRPKVCNIDQMIIVMSLKQPDFSKELLFKFLTYASFNDVKSSREGRTATWDEANSRINENAQAAGAKRTKYGYM